MLVVQAEGLQLSAYEVALRISAIRLQHLVAPFVSYPAVVGVALPPPAGVQSHATPAPEPASTVSVLPVVVVVAQVSIIIIIREKNTLHELKESSQYMRLIVSQAIPQLT